MARIAKVYDYELVVQQKWGRWEDVVYHKTDSKYTLNFGEAKDDLLCYRKSQAARLVKRRIRKTQTNE